MNTPTFTNQANNAARSQRVRCGLGAPSFGWVVGSSPSGALTRASSSNGCQWASEPRKPGYGPAMASSLGLEPSSVTRVLASPKRKNPRLIGLGFGRAGSLATGSEAREGARPSSLGTPQREWILRVQRTAPQAGHRCQPGRCPGARRTRGRTCQRKGRNRWRWKRRWSQPTHRFVSGKHEPRARSFLFSRAERPHVGARSRAGRGNAGARSSIRVSVRSERTMCPETGESRL